MALSSRFTELICDDNDMSWSTPTIIMQRYLVEGITYGFKVPPSSSQTSRVSTKAAELRRKTTFPIRQPGTETCRWNSLWSVTRSLQAAKSLLAIRIRPFPKEIDRYR